MLLSDHGSAPLHTYFCVMNWLVDAGFLALHGAGAARAAWALRGRCAGGGARADGAWVSAGCRASCRAASSARCRRRSPRSTRSRTAIDWSRTRAYCPSAPGSGLFVNLRGREPHGIVQPGREYEAGWWRSCGSVCSPIRDPRTGEPSSPRYTAVTRCIVGHTATRVPTCCSRRAGPCAWSRGWDARRSCRRGGPRGAHRESRA